MSAKRNKGKRTVKSRKEEPLELLEAFVMPESRSSRMRQRIMSLEDTGVLEQRVYHIEKAVADQAQNTATQIAQLAQNVSQQISQVQNTTGQQIQAIATQLGNLGTKLEERAKIPWPALAVMLSFLVVVGGLVWYPISENVRDQKINLMALDKEVTQNYVTRAEYTARTDALTKLLEVQSQLVIDRLQRHEVAQKEGDALLRERIRDMETQIRELQGVRTR